MYDNGILSRAKTSYKNIIETLDAEIIVGDENAYFESEDVFIATANPDALEDYIHPGSLAVTIRVLMDEKSVANKCSFWLQKKQE